MSKDIEITTFKQRVDASRKALCLLEIVPIDARKKIKLPAKEDPDLAFVLKLKETAERVLIEGVEDEDGYAKAKRLYTVSTKVNGRLRSWKTEQKEEALKYCKAIDGYYNRLAGVVSETKDILKAKMSEINQERKRLEEEEKERLEKRYNARYKKLVDGLGMTFDGIEENFTIGAVKVSKHVVYNTDTNTFKDYLQEEVFPTVRRVREQLERESLVAKQRDAVRDQRMSELVAAGAKTKEVEGEVHVHFGEFSASRRSLDLYSAEKYNNVLLSIRSTPIKKPMQAGGGLEESKSKGHEFGRDIAVVQEHIDALTYINAYQGETQIAQDAYSSDFVNTKTLNLIEYLKEVLQDLLKNKPTQED